MHAWYGTDNNNACMVLEVIDMHGYSEQVGACIVNKDKKIVGIGYNGMPNGCSDDELPWGKEAHDKLDTKYPYGRYVCMYIGSLCMYSVICNSCPCCCPCENGLITKQNKKWSCNSIFINHIYSELLFLTPPYT